jgi:hypothetical protein
MVVFSKELRDVNEMQGSIVGDDMTSTESKKPNSNDQRGSMRWF